MGTGTTHNLPTKETILSMDILPSLLSVAGVKYKAEFDGIDFTKVLFNNAEVSERPVFWRYRNQTAARKGKWKYLCINEECYLFDLETDIQEKNNLINSHTSVANELKKLVLEWEEEMKKYPQQTN